MAEPVFNKSRVASQEIWSKPEELTDEQKESTVVKHRWRIISKNDKDELKAVDLLTGVSADFATAVGVKQGLDLGDEIEVREGKTREEDLVVLTKLLTRREYGIAKPDESAGTVVQAEGT